MRIVIVSDLHGNLEALRAIEEESWDELWVLGDVVNYGPDPAEVLEYVRRHATAAVRGNHDHAIGFGVDPRCSPAFVEMALAMQGYSITALNEEQKSWLRGLPLTASRTVGGEKLFLCHATPADPLYAYLPADPALWRDQIAGIGADWVLTGHTHLPFVLEADGKRVVNPGSLGQPKHGRPEACYAVWEDGRVTFKAKPYDAETTVRKLRALPIEKRLREDLATVIRTGAPPVPGLA